MAHFPEFDNHVSSVRNKSQGKSFELSKLRHKQKEVIHYQHAVKLQRFLPWDATNADLGRIQKSTGPHNRTIHFGKLNTHELHLQDGLETGKSLWEKLQCYTTLCTRLLNATGIGYQATWLWYGPDSYSQVFIKHPDCSKWKAAEM